jgi:hypothetical protein
MKSQISILILVCMIIALPISMVLQACSASQKAKEEQALVCIGTEWSDIQRILQSDDPLEVKLEKITPELLACAKQAGILRLKAVRTGDAGTD